jgi:antibiotic biosynthesis monooxygenase (ABM) superfamily enzyme
MYHQRKSSQRRSQVEATLVHQRESASQHVVQNESNHGSPCWFEPQPEPTETEEWGTELAETSVSEVGIGLRKHIPCLRNLRKERSEVFCDYPWMRLATKVENQQ